MDIQTNTSQDLSDRRNWLTLNRFPVPVKVLISATILVMGIAMSGALGQIIVHDIIPTFFSERKSVGHIEQKILLSDAQKERVSKESPSERGDLFSDLPIENKEADAKHSDESEQFIWLLKWTHIHLFGMNMIFIFMGAIAVFLNMSSRTRTWLVVLPFIGVLLDITAMWLKTYVSQIFFWFHIPGGGLFITVYFFVSVKALKEMWQKMD